MQYLSEEEPPDPATLLVVAVFALAMLLALGLASAVLLYPYVALSGGVMSRAEQRRRNLPGG